MELSEAGSGGTASAGTITWVVSEDGDTLSQVEITLQSIECSSESATFGVGESRVSFNDSIPVTDGKIEAVLGERTIKGQFTTPTEAEGTIDLIEEMNDGLGNSVSCDLGTWNWKAQAGTSTSTSTSSTEGTAPANTLSEGALLNLGSAEVEVIKITEATTMPVNETPAAAGMKFILIDLKINKLESGQELNSDQFVLETALGKQYDKPGIVVEVELGTMFAPIGANIKLLQLSETMTLFFEVAEDEDITALQLSYR
jgi:hypothetical protein